jgi:[ribosomal protein S5]-alanine N-acetyltransferase
MLLYSDKLILRPLQILDVDTVFTLRSDHHNNQYLDRPPCQTKEEAAAFINTIISKTENSALKYWVIVLNSLNTVIGSVCLYNHDEENKCCEIGFELLPEFQGYGYVTESVIIVLDFAATIQGMKTVYAHTHKLNSKSIKVLEKCGFAQDIPNSPTEDDLLIFRFSLVK